MKKVHALKKKLTRFDQDLWLAEHCLSRNLDDIAYELALELQIRFQEWRYNLRRARSKHMWKILMRDYDMRMMCFAIPKGATTVIEKVIRRYTQRLQWQRAVERAVDDRFLPRPVEAEPVAMLAGPVNEPPAAG